MINRFVAMGFSERILVKAIEENGEDNEASILDSLLTYSALEKSPQQCQSILEPSPSDSESNIAYSDLSNVNSSTAVTVFHFTEYMEQESTFTKKFQQFSI